MEEALELYDLLDLHVPEQTDQPVFDFVKNIVDSIAEAKSPAYGEALVLMTKKSGAELSEFDPSFLMEMFLTGFIVNDFFGLREFCKDISYGR